MAAEKPPLGQLPGKAPRHYEGVILPHFILGPSDWPWISLKRSTWEAEAGGWRIGSQPGLHGEIKKQKKPGALAHTCNLSYLEGRARRI
jgi:hypothetical protein